MLAIEVKAQVSLVPSRDLAGFHALKEHISKADVGKKFIRGIVLYFGNDIIPLGDDIVAMPLQNLWEFNVSTTTDKKIDSISGDCVFWANYGDHTKIRCLISKEAIDDHFHNQATQKQAITAVQKHWHTIWPVFCHKIVNGQIDIISSPANEKIRQVTLKTNDL